MSHKRVELVEGLYQDGGDFYSATDFIASYPGVVKHDHDTDGATIARMLFAQQHPELVTLEDE